MPDNPGGPAAVAPELRELSRRLLPQVEAFGVAMADRISSEIPLYAEGVLVSREEHVRSCTENIRYVLAHLAGDPSITLDSPRLTGATRAATGVPYPAVLQAFRIGGRFIWEVLVERADPAARGVLLLAAADIWTVSDDLASQVTEAYRTALTDRARRDSQLRAVLVGTLLDGDAAAGEDVWASAETLGLQRAGDYLVVSAECPAPGEEGLNEIERTLQRHNVTSVWRLDHDRQDGLVALRFGFGAEALVGLVAAAARSRVGVSARFDRLDDAPDAKRQARVACTAATPGSQQVVRYDAAPVAVLLASAPDQAAALARTVLGPVLELPPNDGEVLLETARTWLAEDGSNVATAARLHLHRNSVRYRLRRLEELTGRDLTKPVDAAEVHLALECVRLHGLFVTA